ncbi:MAG TPA: TIGR04290 family methyltransferase [Gemmatimonadaceae bacterium]|jgi:tRNA (mo5U34)-methyltransferase|nr:TIGR04290 family methyltransferase [Gemmatimonadaceae bacterium]
MFAPRERARRYADAGGATVTRLLQHFVEAPSEERTREIAALAPWFHNLHLPDGSQTAPGHPLGDFPAFKWRQIGPALPADLSGWTALDIGCNAGFYSIELAKRGAQVTAIDVEPHFLRQAEWASREFDVRDRITFREMQVYDLARVPVQYDLVLFMGVFYHLRYPMLGLDIVAEKVRRLILFQTLTMPGVEIFAGAAVDRDIDDRDAFAEPGWPKLAFIEHEFSGDPTNWWAPNHAACEAMLRSSGLRVIDRPAGEIYLCEPDPNAEPWPRGRGRAELLSATGRASHAAR